jgi:hypothetical protein
MLAKLAPAKAFRLKMPNQISTWLSQLARGWGEVKGNVGVCRQPVVVILVGGEVVEDDMDLPIGRLLGDQVGHKGLEIDAFLGLRGLSPNDAGGHYPLARSSAWIVGFSSTLKTSAFAGGFIISAALD